MAGDLTVSVVSQDPCPPPALLAVSFPIQRIDQRHVAMPMQDGQCLDKDHKESGEVVDSSFRYHLLQTTALRNL